MGVIPCIYGELLVDVIWLICMELVGIVYLLLRCLLRERARGRGWGGGRVEGREEEKE